MVSVVHSVKPYGAFVDLSGFVGLLHVSQISQSRVKDVHSILKEGDKLKVMVLSYDRDRGRITLSTKKLEATPGDMLRDPRLVFDKAEETAEAFKSRAEAFKSLAAATQVGDIVEGVVQSVEPSEAYVDLGGIVGVLHRTQISHTPIESVESILKEGDKLKVMIRSYNKNKCCVTLSTKKLEATPGDMLKDPRLVFDKAEEMAEVYKSRVPAAETQAGTEDVPGDLAASESYIL
ncbi:hypothetical protein V8C86DRAFT_2625499 [Haematococcus lacustris]